MKKMALIASIVSAFFLTACTEQNINSKANILTFATEATYAPFETINEKGEFEGFDIDLANAICHELGKVCKFENIAFDSLIPSLRAGKFDAIIAAMGVTDERKKQVLFTTTYLEATANFLAIKGKFTPQTAKVVGVQNGTTHQKYLSETSNYSIKSYGSLQSAFLDLKNGRIDMIFGDDLVLLDWIKTDASVGFVSEPIKNIEYFGEGNAIAVHLTNTQLQQQINTIIEKFKHDGTLDALYKKWVSDN